MGKITKKNIDELRDNGILSDKAVAEMEEKGLVTKSRRTTIKRFMKTADGKMVTPFMYFRGGQNAKPSQKMEKFTTEYNELVDKYTKPTITVNK